LVPATLSSHFAHLSPSLNAVFYFMVEFSLTRPAGHQELARILDRLSDFLDALTSPLLSSRLLSDFHPSFQCRTAASAPGSPRMSGTSRLRYLERVLPENSSRPDRPSNEDEISSFLFLLPFFFGYVFLLGLFFCFSPLLHETSLDFALPSGREPFYVPPLFLFSHFQRLFCRKILTSSSAPPDPPPHPPTPLPQHHFRLDRSTSFPPLELLTKNFLPSAPEW